MTEILPEPLTAEMPPPYPGGIAAGDDTPADSPALRLLRPAEHAASDDRPGWIPPHILYNWDPDPYAYQTEKEMMPGGGPHGQVRHHTLGITRSFLKDRGLMLLTDVFLLYRNGWRVKQRVGVDLLLMPFRSETPYAYDLDTELLPLLVGEITSPESRAEDMKDKVSLYADLGIPAYLVIDLYNSRWGLREQYELHLWRRTGNGVFDVRTDTDGWLAVPEMRLKIRVDGQKLIFAGIATILRTMEEEVALCRQETARAEQAETRAEQEKARAENAEEEIRLLREKLRAAGILPD